MEELVDIVVPEPVPFWPPGPAWFVLAGMIILLLVWIGWRAFVKWKGNAYRRDALTVLDSMVRGEGGSDQAFVMEVNELLKRVALVTFGRERVASLTGDEWIRFLEQTGGRVESSAGAALESVYRSPRDSRPGDADLRAVESAARTWIRKHRA
jgi:hypothetical protein